jgi:1,5-anhydro-D-fructose reductase (1,5-anhydro-D-mannitol-forming)
MSGRIGWGLIGASNIARQRVAGAIRDSSDGELVAIASHDLKLARAFAAEFAIPHAYDTLAPLLADPRVTAVYVSSTNQHHPPQVLAAAAAGRHVLCEKPLAITLDEALQMLEACRAAGVILATNHHLRNAVTLRAMRTQIARGAIGTPRTVFASHPAWVADSDWRRTDASSGAGVSLDVLVHTADAVRFVLGQEPVEACALGASSPMMPPGGAYDLIMATYRFEGGVLAQLCADFNAPHGRSRLEVHGTDGSLIGTDVLGKGPVHRGRVVLSTKGSESEIAVESEDSRYQRGIDLFHAAVRGHGAPAATGLDGIRSLAMILAAEQAAASGRTVPVSRAGLEPG